MLSLNIPKVGTPFLDANNEISREWRQFLATLLQILGGPLVSNNVSAIVPIDISLTSNITGVLTVTSGGTGTSVAPSNGQLLIGNSGLYQLAALTAGAGIGVGSGAGAITISNIGVTSVVSGPGIGLSGTTGAVTISNTGVTSVTSGSGIGISGTTSLTVSNTGVLSVTGTANQVIASASVGAITLSTPQNTNTGASPTFSGMTVSAISIGGLSFPYALGDWPTQPADGSGVGLGIVNNTSATFVKVGQLVHAEFDFTYPATADGTNAAVTNLPFPSKTGDGGWSVLVGFQNVGNGFGGRVGANSVAFNFTVNGTVQTNANLSGKTIRGVAIYRSAT